MKRKSIGLTSVTFRQKTVEEILDICKDVGLQCIEWGGDVHLPPGDLKKAHMAASKTQADNLRISSYGSYYKLCTNDEIEQAFEPILTTAVVVNAPIIRIWEGTIPSADVTGAYMERVLQELRILCDIAAQYRIGIGLEYHRNTLTDNWKATLELLNCVGRENCTLTGR